MIKILGNTLNYSDLASQYPHNGPATDIIHILSSSNLIYNYDSLNQLKFEINLRNKIIDSAYKLYRSNFSFKIFRKSTCNSYYWTRTNEGGFLLNSDSLPSDAIADIYINSREYGTECATAMVIVFFKALLDILPKELFDSTFPGIYLMNWQHLHMNLAINFIRHPGDYMPGDCRYFKNPDVNPETPEWQGENVIDMGRGVYYGHGVGIKPGDVIIGALNKYRIDGSEVSAYLTDSATRPNFKYLANRFLSFTQ